MQSNKNHPTVDVKKLGIVYAMTNPAMPGLVKIGMTRRTDIRRRQEELNNTSVPLPFDVRYACHVPFEKTKEIESAIQESFGPYRVSNSREFFRINLTDAILKL